MRSHGGPFCFSQARGAKHRRLTRVELPIPRGPPQLLPYPWQCPLKSTLTGHLCLEHSAVLISETPAALSDAPAAHYDTVTPAWRFLLGRNLHYGLFRSSDQPLDDATDNLTARLADAAAIESQSNVLDVGCGTGQPALYLALRFGCAVTGISTSPVGVRIARENARRAGLGERVRIELRDAQCTRLPSARFDRAWVLESSHLMPDKLAMLRECARVLRPGGILALCDVIMHRRLAMKDVMRRARDFDLLRRVFGRARMETLETYESWCRECGFLTIEIENLSDCARPTFARWRENAARFERRILPLIGRERLDQFIRSCSVLERLWDEGILGYGLIAARKW